MSQADQRAAAAYKTGGSDAAVEADLETAIAALEETSAGQEHTAADMTDPNGYDDVEAPGDGGSSGVEA